MSFYNKNQKVIILLLRPVFFQDFYDAVVIIGRGCETADFLEFGVSACHCVAVVRMPQQFTVVEIIAESHCLIWRNAEFLLQKFDCRAFADTFLHNVNPMLSGKGNVEMRKMFQHKRINAGFGVFENHPVKELVKNEDFKKWITPGSGFVPEGAEPTEQFHARCSETLLKLFEYMIRMDVTEAACVTHGGVIMSMLSQRALPSRHPEQWMADPGCGYTVQTDVQLWMRDRLVEAIDIVPFGYADTLRGQAEAEENEAFE